MTKPVSQSIAMNGAFLRAKNLRANTIYQDYTSPVFYWTNIEMAMAVVSACLPTLRPIWIHFFGTPPPPTGYSGDSYKSYGSRKATGYAEVSGIGMNNLSRDRDEPV